MASRAGRKRKPGQREPNGRPQRPTQSVLNELNQREAMKVKSVVLMQPHRNGSEAKECATALGRFWMALRTPDNRLPLLAGEGYADLVRRWRAAHGIAAAAAPEEATGTGAGPAWSTVQGWLRQIEDIERALLKASGNVLLATKRLVVDDLDPETRQQHFDARVGLNIVAIELGLVGKDHPFH